MPEVERAPTPAYEASNWGNTFHQLTCREALGAGAAGPGKTTVLLADTFPRLFIEHERATNRKHPFYFGPGNSSGWGLHLRRTVKQLEQTIDRAHRLFPVFDPGAKYDISKTTWRFSSGYKYQFGHCKDSLSWEDYFSSQYDWIGFDELVQFEEDQYHQIAGRCRSSDPVLSGCLKVRAMSNPMQRHEGDDFTFRGNPHWVRDYFVAPHPAGKKMLTRTVTLDDGTVEKRQRLYLPAKLSDNPDKAFVRQYETTLRMLKPHIQQALLHGNWFITAGSYFGEEWNESLHIVEPFRISPHWPVARSMDWGYKKPGCVHWGALDDDDNLIVFRELTFKGKTDEQVAEDIKVIETKLGLWKGKRSLIGGVADPQLWERRGESGKSKADVFADAGVSWARADRRSRRSNAERISKRLMDHDGGTKTPGLVFFRGCKRIIETLPAIQTDKNGEDPQDGGDDHWLDCLHGSTEVTTSRGRVSVEMLRDGDLVLSTDGRFWPCSGGRFIRRSGMLEVKLANGESLVATPNHLVLCINGEWKRVDHLDSSCYAYAPWIQPSLPPPAKSSMASATIGAGAISAEPPSESAEVSFSTEKCGDWFVAAFQRATTFIMSIMTRATTGSETWSLDRLAFTGPNISETPRPHMGAPTSRSRRNMQGHGMRVLPGENGIESTRRNRSTNLESRWCESAPGANKSSSSGRPRWPSSARETVRQRRAAQAASTTKNEFALPVGASSWLTGMCVKPPALGRAVKIVSVRPALEGDTWCTTVPHMGAFVASGIVVSNSVGYMCALASLGRASFGRAVADINEEQDDVQKPKGDRGRDGYGSRV